MPALLWEGNEPGTDAQMTYRQVLDAVSRLVRPALGSRPVLGQGRRKLPFCGTRPAQLLTLPRGLG